MLNSIEVALCESKLIQKQVLSVRLNDEEKRKALIGNIYDFFYWHHINIGPITSYFTFHEPGKMGVIISTILNKRKVAFGCKKKSLFHLPVFFN